MVRRIYTPDLANRSLPLVRSIAENVRETAMELDQTWQQLQEVPEGDSRHAPLEERVKVIQERFGVLVKELDALGVELKDPFQGLLDFRAKHEGREVYLCWRLGEDSVDHWHEIEAGFRGRQPIDEAFPV